MRIDAGQHMRMSQQMKLAPRMIQSMEILQLPLLALEERLEQELASNPTLELREAGDDPREVQEELAQAQRDAREGERELVVEDRKESGHTDDFERLTNYAADQADTWEANTTGGGEFRRAARADGERDAKMDAMANTAARPPSLTEQLLDQWMMVEAPAGLKAAGEYLIGLIDADGYLRTEQPAILAQCPPTVNPADLEPALALLQANLEPVGLAARDLRECLLLQIDARIRAGGGHNLAIERRLVAEFLKDIEGNRLPRIAAALGVEVETVKKALLNLRQFHPHPGRLLAEERPRTITPDAIVEYDEVADAYVARLTQDRLPSVQINPRYARMARDRGVDRKTREFIGGNLRSARWLLDAIQQRQNTLLRVINVVLQAQREYFDQGPQHLKPLPMTLVADQLGIHVATVSRAANGKYLQTPRGILPLRMFFSGGTETDTGESMSWAAVQAMLKEVIDAEDTARPLSDDELVVKLKEKGVEIARRTVAKYRKQLHIAPAKQRRQY